MNLEKMTEKWIDKSTKKEFLGDVSADLNVGDRYEMVKDGKLRVAVIKEKKDLPGGFVLVIEHVTESEVV